LGVTAEVLAATALAVWLYLIFARGGFWRATERDDWPSAKLAEWPSVAVVVPARNEADLIGASMGSLARQDYPGPWTIILVDDESSDGTADTARQAFVRRAFAHQILAHQILAHQTLARQSLTQDCSERLRVVSSRTLPAGWTGKLWAVQQGIELATALPQPPRYLLLTDADIVHPSDSLRRLVGHAHSRGLVLASLMVKLRCESFAERLSIPAFVFFFQMLYPFAWVNRPQSRVAAAAGGCMLLRADALARAGGIEIIRAALIDDCALARALKPHGPIWLGLTTRLRSLRPCAALADIRGMVARSAYAQLRYSPLLLIGTTAGMILTYLVPPAMALLGTGVARALGVAAWGLMAFAFVPTLRLYARSPLWGMALPAIALQYLIFTLDSAYQHMRGRGGTWKGRAQANASELP
jgi:hopene-associated glycosyltransferase HpnB